MSCRSLGSFCLFALFASAYCWQQDVEYRIDVTLDTRKHTLKGTEHLLYRNRSPDELDFLWIHLYPNAYKDRSSTFAREMEESGSYRFAYSSVEDRGFMDILAAQADGHDLRAEIEGTRMKLWLPAPLCTEDSVEIVLDFFVKIPKMFSRLGHEDTCYEIVQWYPKPAVYDERGWHPDGYHAIGEFYGEFGRFDVRITLPDEMIVGATGTLVGPESEIERMDAMAIQGERLETLKSEGKANLTGIIDLRGRLSRTVDETCLKTLRFAADHVHDFAWCASPDFRLIRDNHGDTRIDVLYFPWNESQWRLASEHAKRALELYGRWYMPYPYPTLTLVNSVSTLGMEYPTLVVVGVPDVPFSTLFEQVMVHEVGHQWFYGVLGNDEMNEAWLDEGMNTFSELRYMETRYGRERNMLDMPEPIPSVGYRWLLKLMYHITTTCGIERPILTKAHEMSDEPVAYAGGPCAKGAFLMDMLRNHLGEERFDDLMHAYFERFRFRHPHSEDFIALAEEHSGEDLDWFFDPWLHGTGTCDYAVQGFSSHRQDSGRGFETRVLVERLGDVRMPVEVTLETKEGEIVTRRIDGLEDRTVLCFETRTPGARVSLDPEGKILEVDRWNNHFPRRVEFRPIFDFPSFDASYLWLGPSGSLNSYDGLRLGLWLRGGQFPDFEMVRGRNNFTLGTSYGFGSRKVWYDFSFGTPLHFRRNRIRIGMGIAKGWGQHKAHVEIRGRFAGRISGPPEHLLLAGIRMRDVYDLEPLSPRNWERAWTLGPVLEYTFRMKTLGFSGRFSAGYRSSFPIRTGDRRYDRLYCDLSSRLRVNQGAFLDLRVFCGWSRGEIPSQDQFYLYGRLEPEGIAAYIADGKGSFGTQEHVHISGDGNMLGYINQYRRDRVILTMNLGFTVPFLPLEPFLDVGALSGELSSLDEAPFLSDFGLKLDLSVLRLYFPLWVSHPRSEEKKWGFRWLLELGPRP